MKNRLLTTVLLTIVLTGCSKFEEPVKADKAATILSQTRARAITYQILPDPYSLTNMQEVYDEFDGETELEATDLYVRFLPQDTAQLNLLEEAYDLPLFDYPLDLDIPDNAVYVDPTIEGGEPKWCYVGVPANLQNQNIGFTYA